MEFQFLTMLTGFIAILFTIVNSNNALRRELKEDISREISRLDTDIKTLSTKLDTEIEKLGSKLDYDIKAVNSKLDTLIMALFRQNLNIPESNPEKKDVA